MISFHGWKFWAQWLITRIAPVYNIVLLALSRSAVVCERVGRFAVEEKGLFLIILGYALFCVGMGMWVLIFIQTYTHSPQAAQSIDFSCF